MKAVSFLCKDSGSLLLEGILKIRRYSTCYLLCPSSQGADRGNGKPPGADVVEENARTSAKDEEGKG